jgi:hypothetical protein
MKRKIFNFALVVLFVVFFGCSKTESPSTPSTPSTPSPVLSDMVNWTQVNVTNPFTPTDWNTALVYDNKMWLIGGRISTGDTIAEVWSSTDGADWTLVTGNAAFGPRFRHASVVFNNKMWVIGGTPVNGYDADCLNDVWYSTNGADWTLATGNAEFQQRFSFRTYDFNNKIWVIGGVDSSHNMYNDVWNSSDGVTWTQITANANFIGRNSYSGFVFNNYMWVIAGYDDLTSKDYNNCSYSGEANDVWRSSNGVDWELVTGNAGFSPRTAQTAFTADGKMFIGMGYDDCVNLNDDLWYSNDGRFWTLISWNLTGTPRMRANALVYNGKVWIIGGSDCTGQCPMNEVWVAD